MNAMEYHSTGNVSLRYMEWVKNPGDPEIKKYLVLDIQNIKETVQGGKILDVGSGYGRVLREMEERCDECWGIEINPQFVEISKKYVPKGRIILGDARRMPFEDETFDYVVCINNTLGNIRFGKVWVVKEMQRVLKTGGTGIISVYSDQALENRIRSYEKTGLKIRVLANGTVLAENDPIYSEQFTKRFLRNLMELAGIKKYKIWQPTKVAYFIRWVKR